MELIYPSLCFCLGLSFSLAYPVDYNETSVEITREALNNLISLISENNFPKLLQLYNDDISQVNNRTYEKIKTISSTFSIRLYQVQEIANNANANTADCLLNLNLTAEELYQEYTLGCVNPSRALGLNLITAGSNKQSVVFFKKYSELISYFTDCLEESDPTPRICAGVVHSTLQEVRRILPAVEANPVQIQGELRRQILLLSDCAHEHISGSNKRFQVEFNKAKMCILDKINIA